MSMVEALGRIQQIQNTLTQLSTGVNPQKAPASSQPVNPAAVMAGTASAGTTGTGNSANAFAKALDATVGATGSGKTQGPSSVTVPERGGLTGADFVASAKKYIGVPYVWGGEDATGMDCSGFVQKAFKDIGIDMPRLARAQMDQGTLVPSFAEARPGDLISSFNGDHISIYLGNGKAIDAPVPGKTIQIRDAWEMDSNLEKIVRILPAESDVQAAAGPSAASGPASQPINPVDVVAASRAAMLSGASS